MIQVRCDLCDGSGSRWSQSAGLPCRIRCECMIPPEDEPLTDRHRLSDEAVRMLSIAGPALARARSGD